MLYQVISKQKNRVVANIITYVDIQIGDKIDYVKEEKEQLIGHVIERLIIGMTSVEKFPLGREDVHTIQIVIDQEVPT